MDGDPVYVIDEYLKQSAIDHKEEIKKAKQKGIYKSKSIINIDSPRDLSIINNTRESFVLRGWLVTDDEEAKLKSLFWMEKK